MLAIVVLTDNNTETVGEQAITAAMLIVVLLLTLVILLAANVVYKVIGNTGVSVISRVMGIVLATIAVDSILGGFDALGVLEVSPPALDSPLAKVAPD